MFNWALKHWKLVVVIVVIADALIVGGLVYIFVNTEASRVSAAELARLTVTPTATATATATPWPGPGKRVTPTPTLPPTPEPTEVLSSGGFPVGFTPTPFPTREKVKITMPHVYPVHRTNLDVPVINQIYYPEPFFPPGSNNACGPVAMYAGLRALGLNIDYTRLRNHAVGYGFTHYGISKSGMINTLRAINSEQNNSLHIEYGDKYATKDLIRHIRTGGIAIVLLQVRKEGGQFRVVSDSYNSFGHFLIVDSINMRSNTVNFAGSTLGMEQVPLRDFLQSWSGNTQLVNQSPASLNAFMKQEKGNNWAIIIHKRP